MLSGNTFSQKILFLEYDEMQDNQTRYESWVKCHTAFANARRTVAVDKDALALCLGFYLFSWGMFRNSFLRGNSYSIHKKVVDLVLDLKYKILWDYDPLDKGQEELKEAINLIIDFCEKVEKHYSDYGAKIDGKPPRVSVTLLSKICLGTFACLPAFDSNVKAALSKSKKAIFPKEFTQSGILSLMIYVQNKYSDFSPSLKANWPIMKRADAALWQYGRELLAIRALVSGGTKKAAARTYLTRAFGSCPSGIPASLYYSNLVGVKW
jgi:hypothetical protein